MVYFLINLYINNLKGLDNMAPLKNYFYLTECPIITPSVQVLTKNENKNFTDNKIDDRLQQLEKENSALRQKIAEMEKNIRLLNVTETISNIVKQEVAKQLRLQQQEQKMKQEMASKNILSFDEAKKLCQELCDVAGVTLNNHYIAALYDKCEKNDPKNNFFYKIICDIIEKYKESDRDSFDIFKDFFLNEIEEQKINLQIKLEGEAIKRGKPFPANLSMEVHINQIINKEKTLEEVLNEWLQEPEILQSGSTDTPILLEENTIV